MKHAIVYFLLLVIFACALEILQPQSDNDQSNPPEEIATPITFLI
jgi:hypothetical protein